MIWTIVRTDIYMSVQIFMAAAAAAARVRKDILDIY